MDGIDDPITIVRAWAAYAFRESCRVEGDDFASMSTITECREREACLHQLMEKLGPTEDEIFDSLMSPPSKENIWRLNHDAIECHLRTGDSHCTKCGACVDQGPCAACFPNEHQSYGRR